MPDVLLGEAVKEVLEQFDAVSFYRNAAEGYWIDGDTLYRDDLGLLIADIPDIPANRKWMKAFKSRWKARLNQLEIWMVSYPIQIE